MYNRSNRETAFRQCVHADPRVFALSMATLSSSRMATTFLPRSAPGECRDVRLARGSTNASRTSLMPVTQVRWIIRLNPASAVSTVAGASDTSKDIENTASIAGHATSSMGLTHEGSVAV